MSKHTPGPWKATHCTVSAPETADRLGFSINVRNGNREDTRANARLIAAAPDLLGAASMALGIMNVMDWENDPVADRLKAAIKKATGVAT